MQNFDPSKDTKKIIIMAKILEHWIREHYLDLNAEFIAKLVYFLDKELASAKIGKNSIGKIIQPVQRALQKKLMEVKFTRKIVNTKPLPDPIIPSKFNKNVKYIY